LNNHSEIINFLWSVADLIRDAFKRGKYQDVILPFTVLRRIDCVLAPTREAVWTTNAKYKRQIGRSGRDSAPSIGLCVL